MNRFKMSYLAWFMTCLLVLLLFAGKGNTQNIYLTPDIQYYTNGPGDEFDLDIYIDDATIGVRLYQIFINYQPSLLDTVYSELGPLFDNSGYGTFFRTTQVTDSVSGDTALRVEALLLGPGATVDGPGLVGTIRMKVVGAGTADLSILNFTLTDVNNDTIPDLTAAGAVAYLDAPPEPFSLISPLLMEEVTLLPNDSVELLWESTTSPYPGEGVVYDLEVSTSSAFVAESTVVVSGLNDTSSYLYAPDLRNGIYYWRVSAVGDIYNFKRTSDIFWFDYSDGAIEPSSFNLVFPGEGEEITRYPGEDLVLTWQASNSVDESENVLYTLEYSTSPSFEQGSTVIISSLTDTTYTIDILSLITAQYYWRVTAIGDLFGGVTPSTPFPGTFDFVFGAVEPEPFELIGPAHGAFININSISTIQFSWQQAVSIIPNDSIMYYLYLGPGSSFPGDEVLIDSTENLMSLEIDVNDLPWGEQDYWRVEAVNKFDLTRWSTSTFEATFFYRGDVDNNKSLDVSDLLYLVDYMFLQPPGPAPVIYQAGDMECSGNVDITDLLFLVDYMFLQPPGPFPGCQ